MFIKLYGRGGVGVSSVRPFVFTRFLSNPFIIRVPFFLMFSFNKGTLNQKGQKGTTQEPSLSKSASP